MKWKASRLKVYCHVQIETKNHLKIQQISILNSQYSHEESNKGAEDRDGTFAGKAYYSGSIL